MVIGQCVTNDIGIVIMAQDMKIFVEQECRPAIAVHHHVGVKNGLWVVRSLYMFRILSANICNVRNFSAHKKPGLVDDPISLFFTVGRHP